MSISVESNLPASVLERWLQSSSGLDEFLEQFLSQSLSIREWTHRAHIGVASALALKHGRGAALEILKDAIPRYNEATGGANTESSGYHETLTVFWMDRVAELLERLPTSMDRLTKVRVVVEAYGLVRRLDRAYYSFDVVTSREARRRWIEPDR